MSVKIVKAVDVGFVANLFIGTKSVSVMVRHGRVLHRYLNCVF